MGGEYEEGMQAFVVCMYYSASGVGVHHGCYMEYN